MGDIGGVDLLCLDHLFDAHVHAILSGGIQGQGNHIVFPEGDVQPGKQLLYRLVAGGGGDDLTIVFHGDGAAPLDHDP